MCCTVVTTQHRFFERVQIIIFCLQIIVDYYEDIYSVQQIKQMAGSCTETISVSVHPLQFCTSDHTSPDSYVCNNN